MKKAIQCFALAGSLSAPAYCQTSGETTPAFEVASVKPAANPESALRIDGAAVRCTCPLDVLIMYAYEIKPYQLRGPSWITETRTPYQVDANIPKKSTKEQIPAMVRGMLAERFHLAAHRESRESPVYALTLDQGGLEFAVRPAQEPSQPTPQAPQFRSYIDITTGRIHYEGILTLKQFANLLTGMMDRPVVNITGADGEFDILFDARIPVSNLKPIPVFILPDGSSPILTASC